MISLIKSNNLTCWTASIVNTYKYVSFIKQKKNVFQAPVA